MDKTCSNLNDFVFSSFLQIYQEGDKYQLEIPEATANAKGRYFCVAKNDVGTARCGVSLVVQALQGVEIADFRAMLKNKWVTISENGKNTPNNHWNNENCIIGKKVKISPVKLGKYHNNFKSVVG